jgi:AraC-like DNA-binding protein
MRFRWGPARGSVTCAFDHWIAIVTAWFRKFPPIASTISLAVDSQGNLYGGYRIDSLVQHTGLSIRNFQRAFQQRIGLSPKLYSRIVRFESALKAKAHRPTFHG